MNHIGRKALYRLQRIDILVFQAVTRDAKPCPRLRDK